MLSLMLAMLAFGPAVASGDPPARGDLPVPEWPRLPRPISEQPPIAQAPTPQEPPATTATQPPPGPPTGKQPAPRKPAGAWGSFRTALDASTLSQGTQQTRGLGARVGQTWYSQPVLDDGSPRSLQPFLQRVSSQQVFVSAGGFTTSVQSASPKLNVLALGVGLSADQYLTELLVFSASGSITRWSGTLYTDPKADYAFALPVVALGPALRLGDTRVDIGYRYAPITRPCPSGVAGAGACTTTELRGWGQLEARVSSVLWSSLGVSLDAHTLPSGASVQGGFTYHLGRDLAAGAALVYERGELYFDSSAVFRRLIGVAGISYWLNQEVSASLQYELTSEARQDGKSALGHLVALNFGLRLY